MECKHGTHEPCNLCAEEDAEHDIVECHRCGRQWTVPCIFDEDYS